MDQLQQGAPKAPAQDESTCGCHPPGTVCPKHAAMAARAGASSEAESVVEDEDETESAHGE